MLQKQRVWMVPDHLECSAIHAICIHACQALPMFVNVSLRVSPADRGALCFLSNPVSSNLDKLYSVDANNLLSSRYCR